MAEQDDSKRDEKQTDRPTTSDDGKVVEFPLHKARKPKPVNADGVPAEPPSVKKKALVVSLLSALLVATFLSSRTGVQRLPQAVDDRPDLEADIVAAKKINHSSLREPASGGREPTAEDLLRHGELANYYALQFSPEGALRSLEFSPESGGSPRKIESRSEFLKKYKSLFRIPFDDLAMAPTYHDSEHTFEVYNLVQSSRVVARVHFTLTAGNTLTSMKVEPVNSEETSLSSVSSSAVEPANPIQSEKKSSAKHK